jgi:FkbM family methyltransferase
MDIFLKKYLIHHPCPVPICLPTDKYARKDKIKGIKKVCSIQKSKLEKIYQPMLSNLKEKYKTEKRCFIIGNGPSINNTDLTKLKSEITFGVNGIFLKFPDTTFRPTFYVVEDHLVAEDRAKEINELRGVIKLFPVYLAYCLNESPDTIFFNHRPRKSYPHGFDFSTDAAKVTYTGGTVTFTCLQMAYYLGFREIYLIGVDHSYTIPDSIEKKKDYSVEILDMRDDDPNHFSPDYFGKGYRWHDPRPEVMEDAYREAKKITGARGVTIYNATKGGCLEVFPRVCYEDLFHNVSMQGKKIPNNSIVNLPICSSAINRGKCCSTPVQKRNKGIPSLLERCHFFRPKILVVSSTLMNCDSATGALVKNLFLGWPKAALAQLHTDHGMPELDVCDKYFRLSRKKYNFDTVMQQVREFKPELIYLRLVDSPLVLLNFVKEYLKMEKIPLITHIMDDWPERARTNNPELFLHATPLLCELFQYASYNLSICDHMSFAFEQRFGVPFKAVSNFIDPEDLTKSIKKQKKRPELFTIRYCGSLASDMQLASVVDVAQAVGSLQDEIPVRLEIYVHRRFRKNARKLRRYKGTEIRAFVPHEDYKELLSNADLLLLAANFDSESLNYIRYSMANKLPEYMASGTPILAYGPVESATIRYAQQGRWAKTVTKCRVAPLVDAIKELYWNIEQREHLGQATRRCVLKHHRADKVRNAFQKMLVDAATKNASMDNENKQTVSETLIGEYSRADKMRINESDLVAQLVASDKNCGIMVDVGAHFGSALPPFLEKGWKIFAFEPDEKNREILDKRYGNWPNLVIDKRAVSNRTAKKTPFFTSKESTGISSLASFHETHEQTGNVSVTTLGKFCEEQKIDHINFLLVDAEGYDLFVLKGLDWVRIKPDIVVCEFEDHKTNNLGYNFHDMATFLKDQGYEVLVSEWHPILRYGIAHDWRRLARYPCELANPEAWGNLIAFREIPNWQTLLAVVARQAIPLSRKSTILTKVLKAIRSRTIGRLSMLYW